VVDFVDLQWWPVFNVADAAVCVGAVLLVLTAAREPTPSS
jgi:signal peptidase II